MLRLQPDMNEAFLAKYKKQILEYMLSFIPPLMREEGDDLTAFVQRALMCARDNKVFTKRFVHRGDTQNKQTKEPTDSDIRAYTMFLLEHAGVVGLWKPETETHGVIDRNGDIKTYNVEVPQIEISWETDKKTNRFRCMIHFVEGDVDCVAAWDI